MSPFNRKDMKVKVIINTVLSNKSWVRHQHSLLLDHERGHYLLGCLCALEFKKRVEDRYYTENTVKRDIWLIFKKTLDEFLEIEIQYDLETEHYIN